MLTFFVINTQLTSLIQIADKRERERERERGELRIYESEKILRKL